jgi:hypothetical protein
MPPSTAPFTVEGRRRWTHLHAPSTAPFTVVGRRRWTHLHTPQHRPLHSRGRQRCQGTQAYAHRLSRWQKQGRPHMVARHEALQPLQLLGLALRHLCCVGAVAQHRLLPREKVRGCRLRRLGASMGW